jgi:hypothetical protein
MDSIQVSLPLQRCASWTDLGYFRKVPRAYEARFQEVDQLWGRLEFNIKAFPARGHREHLLLQHIVPRRIRAARDDVTRERT